MNDLAPKTEAPGFQKVGGKLRVGGSPLEARVKAAEAIQSKPEECKNRLILAADCSGSMAGEKIQILRDSAEGFSTDSILDRETSVGLETFPRGISIPLSMDINAMRMSILGLHACGGTPMRQCLEEIINNQDVTRVVLISDGQPTDWHILDYDESLVNSLKNDPVIKSFLAKEIPVDCIHIDRSNSGEKFLKAIAEVTGGIFVKFADAKNLRKGLRYLTPQKRLMLTTGNLEIEGATEVKI